MTYKQNIKAQTFSNKEVENENLYKFNLSYLKQLKSTLTYHFTSNKDTLLNNKIKFIICDDGKVV